MALLSPPPKMQFFGDDGLPLSLGKIYTYAKGTTNPLTTYVDSSATNPNANPIILDSNGRANVWLQQLPYSFVIYDSEDVLQGCSGDIEFPPASESGSSIEAWSDIVVYNFPDLVAGSDGYTYRCVGTNNLDDDPVTSTSGEWVNLTPDVNIDPIPTGTIITFSASTPPTGYLECDGSAISRTTYSALFAVIADDYGVGDGSSTFNIPDLRGQFIRGWAHGQSTDPDKATRTDRGDGTTGDAVGTKQAEGTKSHTHSVPLHYDLNTGGYGSIPVGRSITSATTTTGATGGNETRPLNIYMMYCIKY